MNNQDLFASAQLFGCYFHQDWTDEFNTDAEALAAIAKHEPKTQLAKAIREIDALLASSPDEQELRTIVIEQMGCFFEPSVIGMTYRAWLSQVAQRLNEHIATTSLK